MAVLGWLWRRQHSEQSVKQLTPRRLVYCLPMRVLVEQTRDEVQGWLENLGLTKQVKVCVLMGGEDADDWDLYPEKDAILIGTQDMLLSRALNRGYGMSRYRWPIHFGLLNNDCVWVFDEVQLMDVAVGTSAQMESFRRSLGVFSSNHCVWMSATLDEAWLETVDFQKEWLGDPLDLRDEDKQIKRVLDRNGAVKPIQRAEAVMGDTTACAAAILESHQRGRLTLAVFNTVQRAVDVASAIEKRNGGKPVLIHSRFRPPDRKAGLDRLLANPPEEGTIAVTTQVVEAGVDVSAKVLFTEVAPWASLVQRCGRCNRKGEFNAAKDTQVWWFGVPDEEKDRERVARPYELSDLVESEAVLSQCIDAGPASLARVNAQMRLVRDHVIRKRDLVDLFDTTPDLAGNDIDVSRFIRSGEDRDVQVFWRDVPKGQKPDTERGSGKAAHHNELCAVPVGSFREFFKKNRDNVFCWDGLERKWRRPEEPEIYPGQTFMIRAEVGGYDSTTGWNPQSKVAVQPIEGPGQELDAQGRDFEAGGWQSIAEHTDDVVAELKVILADTPLDEDVRAVLLDAARWHDRGKAHSQFQKAVNAELRPAPWTKRNDVAKAPREFWSHYERTGFRHELASALAMSQAGKTDLAVYLAAAHHGKVRLSIRSLPNEKPPPGEAGRLHARGIWHKDCLREVNLGAGVVAPSVELSLECMQLGRAPDGSPSWVERVLRLRKTYGPFQLAYLEALLRAVDMRASRKEAAKAENAEG